MTFANQITQTIERASNESRCAEYGVSLTILYTPDVGYEFCIWKIGKASIAQERLLVSATNYERLLAHLVGFCENTKTVSV